MFVGRERELEQMAAFLANRKPAISVVYGRRRIGKSELIRRSLEGKKALFFEGLESRPKREQIANFILQLRRQVPSLKEADVPKTWREAFFLLEPVLKKSPACVVLDELQWMANYRREIVSDLKMVWEQCLSRIPGVHIVLCGSIASFMTSRVLKSNALYGRTSLTIHLGGFKLSETRALLSGKGSDEVVEAQTLFGGIPKYLELLADTPSIHLGVQELAFRESGYFVDEFDRIFTSHFGNNRDYQKIVEILARHPYGLFRKEIAKRAGVQPGGGLSTLLENLESAAFISSFVPFDKGERSRTIKYTLSDAYLRFYFSFIKPNRKKILSGADTSLFAKISQTGRYFDWRGRAFEYLCMDHAPEFARVLGFSAVDFSVGPYFKTPTSKNAGVQIDLLFDRADNVMTLCEMKYSRAPITTALIDEVEKKQALLLTQFPTKTVQKVLVVQGTVAKALKNSGYFYRIVNAAELLRV